MKVGSTTITLLRMLIWSAHARPRDQGCTIKKPMLLRNPFFFGYCSVWSQIEKCSSFLFFLGHPPFGLMHQIGYFL